MVSRYQLNNIIATRNSIANSAAQVELTVVTKISSGTTNDFFNKSTWQRESTTTITGVGGYSRGYAFNDNTGQVMQTAGVHFVISMDNLALVKADDTYIRYRNEDYAIDEIYTLTDTNEVLIDCSTLK